MTTTFKQEYKQEPADVSPRYQSGCNDFNFDNYINYEQIGVPTPSISPLSYRANSTSTPTPTATGPTTLTPVRSGPLFAPPSHQYDQYRQHAGFAPGAMQNTFAVNQADQYGFVRPNYSTITTPTEGFFGDLSAGDMYDFNTLPSQTSGDLDMDFGSSTAMNTLNSYIDPAAIGGQDTTQRTQPAQPQPGRVYPGMHQQQALAKAQAEAERQAIAKQQQKGQQASHSRQSSRSGSNARPDEPMLDASITRLLNHMRQTSVASSQHDEDDDDAATPNANSHSQRTKKDEEDMDEDERLLASEEGKKLSSKERRQLRNKVSARAFRSRRKEYIGQLEGEISAKDKECEELRKKNENLKAENVRLTDLTQMLLGSPHFQPFLDELSRNSDSASFPVPGHSKPQPQAAGTPSKGSNRPKDINPNQFNRSGQTPSNMHVGLTMIPEEPAFNYISTESINTGYTNMNFGGPFDAQVYAVTMVPQGPAVDRPNFAMLSGKSSNFVGPCPSIEEEVKDDSPCVDTMPAYPVKSAMPEPIESTFEDTTIDVSDAALALFSGPMATAAAKLPALAPEECIFGEIELDKAFGRIELFPIDATIEAANITTDISSAVLERFERLCARCDALSVRVAARTSHL
ncbi:bZIP-type transcription factor MBZ1, partial [Lecanoromycetidae sp. Uapishka_2]